MTDRATPGAKGSEVINQETGIAFGQVGAGWVRPGSDPSIPARRSSLIDETVLDGFDAQYSLSSLTVDIQPGEAFINGWIARDVKTSIDLPDNTTNIEIVLGWNPDAVYDDTVHGEPNEADEVILDMAANVADDVPVMTIWEFSTSNGGTFLEEDRRNMMNLEDRLTDEIEFAKRIGTGYAPNFGGN